MLDVRGWMFDVSQNRMTPVATTFRSPPQVVHHHTTSEPPAVRRALIAVALVFLSLFLFLPLVFVFVQAFAKGIGFYFETLHDPNAWSAIKLTFIAAAIAVPLNCVFGVCAAWAIAKFDFRGKNILLTLIDLPFSVSPVIAGLIYVLVFGARLAGTLPERGQSKISVAGELAERTQHQNYFCRARHRAGDDFCDGAVRRA
jgi:ABC-type sulfate transport system permease subunit